MSQVEVDKIIPQSGTTLTIGDSGDTIAIASGATLSGSISGITNLTITGDLTVDTNTLKVDSANNRVGIGTSSPSVTLDVNGSARVSTGSAYQFGGSDYKIEGSNVTNPRIGFITNSTERMRIDSSGNLLIGTTTDYAVSSSTVTGTKIRSDGIASFFRDNATPLYVGRQNGDGTLIDFRRSGTTVGSIGANSSSLYIAGTSKGFRFTASQLKPCDTSGANDDGNYDLGSSSTRFKDLYLGGGLYVGGTTSANYLDDYEEGTWTPVITSGYSTVTYAIQGGTYTKIGRQVFFTLRLELNPSGTSALANIISIGGLPFSTASSPSGGFAGAGVFSYVNVNIINSTTTNPPIIYLPPNAAGINLYKTTGSAFNATDLNSPTNADFYLTGSYITN